MDWGEVLIRAISFLGIAFFIGVAIAFGQVLGQSTMKPWTCYLIALCAVGYLAFSMAYDLGRGPIIEGPDPYIPGGIRDPSLGYYVPSSERYEYGLLIFLIFAPPLLLGVCWGIKKRNDKK